MSIRPDFLPLPWQLNSLLEYAKVLESNKNDWAHLKNKEDFSQVYYLDLKDRLPLEEIYAIGATVSGMSDDLRQFNYPDYYPTLTSFLKSSVINSIITGKWSDDLTSILKNAEDKVYELKGNSVSVPWAIEQMMKLFKKQIELLDIIRQCLIGLKQSNIYQRENEVLIGSVSVERILECINRTGKRFEDLPATYKQRDEESLRDNILLALSGISDISAYGEVFNKVGKTDILALENGEKKFIAECKFWRGEKVFLGAINQLLSYLTWRDNNVAVIIFVDNVDFVRVIDIAISSIQQHPYYVSLISQRDESWFEYKFNNGNQDINLSLMIYHIPSSIQHS